MRKMFLIIVMIFITFEILPATTEDCYIHRKVESGSGIYHWQDWCKCCPDGGANCEIVPCDEGKLGAITPTQGGYNLLLQLDSVALSLKQPGPGPEVWLPYTRDGKNYPFTAVDYIKITECSAYPSLVGREIDLLGITTDNNGYYTVFIPE